MGVVFKECVGILLLCETPSGPLSVLFGATRSDCGATTPITAAWLYVQGWGSQGTFAHFGTYFHAQPLTITRF